jgi:hypothetical protein
MTKEGLESQWNAVMTRLAEAYLQRETIDNNIVDLKKTKLTIEQQYKALAAPKVPADPVRHGEVDND